MSTVAIFFSEKIPRRQCESFQDCPLGFCQILKLCKVSLWQQSCSPPAYVHAGWSVQLVRLFSFVDQCRCSYKQTSSLVQYAIPLFGRPSQLILFRMAALNRFKLNAYSNVLTSQRLHGCQARLRGILGSHCLQTNQHLVSEVCCFADRCVRSQLRACLICPCMIIFYFSC